MNVLLSSCVRWWNAEAAYAAALAEELRDAGHGVWVLTQPGSRNAEELHRRGVPTVTGIPPAGGRPWRWWRTVSALAEFQTREKIDIVNVFRSQEYPLHLLANRMANPMAGSKAALVRTRGTDRAIRRGWLNTKLHRDWCDAHIASSGIVRERMMEALHLPGDAIRVIYYPTDPPSDTAPEQPPAERREAKRALLAEMKLTGEPLLLGIVGRLYPEKGHQVLLEAFRALLKTHPDSALVILAKNAPGEDPERPALEATVKEQGLAGQVRFLNFREDVRRLMGAMDVGVVPSLASEVNCRVAVEFFSVGTPVVAFPTGALPEVVRHGVSGLVTADHSPAALAEALIRLVDSGDLREELGRGAREAAEVRFSRQRFLQETLAVYEQARLAIGGGSGG